MCRHCAKSQWVSVFRTQLRTQTEGTPFCVGPTFDLTLPYEAGKKFSCVLCFARSHVFSRSIVNKFLTGRSFIKTCRPSVRVLVCRLVCFLFKLVPSVFVHRHYKYSVGLHLLRL